MSAWETVSSTYVEAASLALPLHRVVVFAAGFFGSLSVASETHLSVLETVLRIELSSLTSLNSGPLALASIGNVFFGFGLVFLAWALSRGLLWAVFTMGAKATNLWSKVDEANKKYDDRRFIEAAERQASVSLIEASLQETRARVRACNAFAEIFCGLGVGCSIGYLWGNVLDLLVGFCSFAIALTLHVVAVRIFLAEYFGPALLKAQLQGRRPPTPLSGS